MLQTINDKAKGWVAYLIVGFIAVPFALFGISSYLGGSNSLVAATVNGEEIPVQEVQNIVLQQRQRMAQIFGGKLPPGFDEGTIKLQALEQAVSQALLRQEAVENGYRASNQEVFDTIAGITAFHKDGQFDPETYERLLQSQRRTKSSFEADIRNSITHQQFSQAVSKAAFIPDSQVSLYQRLQNQERDVETFTLKAADYQSQVEVSTDEIKKHYDNNASNYMTAEKVKLSYIELKQSDIAKTVTVEDDALALFYDENLSRYTTPEQRKLAHILVKITDDDKEGTAAKQKADDLLAQITAGTKTFEELATSDSDDELAAKNKGELGVIERGDMGALFEKEAFSLEKGKISGVVKTDAGYEIIKVLDIVASTQQSLEEVKDKVEALYRSEEAEKLFLDQSEQLQTLAFENDSSLDEAADSVGLKVLTSDWLERGMTPDAKNVMTSPKVIAAAFGEDVLNAGKNSELLEIDSATIVFVRLQEHQVPAQKALAEVQDNIKNSLLAQKTRTLLIEKGEAALKMLKDSNQWSVAEDIGATSDKLEITTSVKRNDTKIPATVVQKLFSMQKPEAGKKSFDNAILPNGDYVLVALTNVKDGSGDIDSSLRKSFTQMVASREQSAMLKALREQAEVELFPENIQ